jgi:hypothetical protein
MSRRRCRHHPRLGAAFHNISGPAIVCKSPFRTVEDGVLGSVAEDSTERPLTGDIWRPGGLR